ncbi:hypothetical protein P6P90_09905 [Ectobacillus antri]|jgi:hypothetical protein|uniref:Uncharacterized protein n=1 Tax=Ectobacillus antri TaxID=2486280 RepID=A0ABT6H4Z0_9BACI|nr:hypothetical protein [Ectobacillus antri]MDG4656819.1 hypothetical protein [Ectobacillus antri]MDG5754284.1 hypothetical protein [Ectobacillus antri]
MPFTDGTYQGFGLYPGTYNMQFDYTSKMHHDSYEVYVNEDFVGMKAMTNDAEHIQSVAEFLHGRGFTDFTSSIDGDHYTIHTKEQAALMKEYIAMYLNNR